MRRSLLLSLMGLGLVISLVGGTGIFAPFTDKADSGPNSVTSAERPKAADLKLAIPVNSIDCSGVTYLDNTTSPVTSATNAEPGFADEAFFCLKNAGSSALTVTITTSDVVDTDVACTGDEAAAGDTTCGEDAGGELSKVLFVRAQTFPCGGGSGTSVDGDFLNAAPSIPIGTVAPGAVICGSVRVGYPLNRSDTEVQQAQTDKVTWKYEFNGVTA